MSKTTVPLEDVLAEEMKDAAFREAYEALEPAYQVARLRIARGLTQEELAHKVGTKQPSIARLESGRVTPNLAFLQRIAEALDAKLVVRLEPK